MKKEWELFQYHENHNNIKKKLINIEIWFFLLIFVWTLLLNIYVLYIFDSLIMIICIQNIKETKYWTDLSIVDALV